jgi:predicted DsbA family dithiol-disulfide isomerase
MKQRNGFVSNSSSSSFVVAIKKQDDEVCPHCGRGIPNLLKAIEEKERYGGETELEGTGIDAVLEYVDEMRKYDDDDYHKDEADRIRKKAATYGNDWELAVFYVSYHDEFINQMIKEMKAAGTIEILDEEG